MRLGLIFDDHRTRPKPILIDADTGDRVAGVKSITINSETSGVTECLIKVLMLGKEVK